MQLSTQLCIQDKPRPHWTSVEPELHCNTTSIVARTQNITKKGKGCNLKILSLFNLIQTLSCTISLFKKDQNHNRYQVTPCKLSPQHSKHKKQLLTSHHHHGHGEDLLPVGRGGDVAKADGRQAGHGEIQRGDIERVLSRAALPLARTTGVVAVRWSDVVSQLIEPAVHLDRVGGLIYDFVVSDAVPVEDKIKVIVEENPGKTDFSSKMYIKVPRLVIKSAFSYFTDPRKNIKTFKMDLILYLCMHPLAYTQGAWHLKMYASHAF